MLSKKSIVMSGVKNPSQRAVLSIECDGEMAKGRLRLYNFGVEPKGILSLGLYQDGQVVKAGLIRTSGMLYTFACQFDKLKDNFSCAVINFVDGDPAPILYGNGDGYVDKDKVFNQVLDNLGQAKSVSEVEEVLDAYNIDFDDELKEEIDNEIDKCLTSEENNIENVSCNKPDCKNCKYKEFYFSSVKFQQIDEEPKEENLRAEDSEEKEENKKFYLELKSQIDDLFANNPTEEYLQEMLPNSKWVKVNIDENGNYYVLGLIYEGEKLLYICYGLPGVYQKNAPRELSGYPVWFPLEESKPQGFGYWLSYQDAESGESVKAVLV